MKITLRDYILCGIALVFLLSLSLSFTAFASFFVTRQLLGSYFVLADFFLFLVSHGVFSALLLRLLLKIRPIELGQFEMDHPNIIYWRVACMICMFGELALKPFTPLPFRPLITLLFGGKIAQSAVISGEIGFDPHLVTIGEESIIGAQAQVSGDMSSNGKIVIGEVVIGKGVTIGSHAIVLPNVKIGDNAVVGIGSVVMPGTIIPEGEVWRGNPARKWL